MVKHVGELWKCATTPAVLCSLFVVCLKSEPSGKAKLQLNQNKLPCCLEAATPFIFAQTSMLFMHQGWSHLAAHCMDNQFTHVYLFPVEQPMTKDKHGAYERPPELLAGVLRALLNLRQRFASQLVTLAIDMPPQHAPQQFQEVLLQHLHVLQPYTMLVTNLMTILHCHVRGTAANFIMLTPHTGHSVKALFG